MTRENSDSRRRFLLAYVFVSILVAALSMLAILQYRWITAVSKAERQRMQASVQLATSGVAEEFNGEVARALMSLVRPQRFPVSGAFGELFLQWAATSRYPQLVRNVFFVERSDRGEIRLLRFDTNSKLLESCDWPARLDEVKTRLLRNWPADDMPPQPPPGVLFLSGEPPVALAPLPVIHSAYFPFPPPPSFSPPISTVIATSAWAIVEFDQDFITTKVLPGLIKQYFAALGQDEYRVLVVGRNKPHDVVYQSGSLITPADFGAADSTADLFVVRPGRFVVFTEPAARGIQVSDEVFTVPLPMPYGHWQMLIEHRLGSLDAAVNRLRRRNLGVSFAILLVLVGAVVMMIIASERERQLARLQMQFAAAASHELRTPLTVIQALTHNLSVGIVRNPAHIQEYARMVHDEARGLSSIVDQVLLFAETRSIRRKYEAGPVEVVDAVDRALSSLASQIRTTGTEIITDIPDDLPRVHANPVCLAHCLRNLVSNAMKYGAAASCDITIVATAASREVMISVIDHGPGIAPDDLRHLFEAFFRGRTAKPGIRGAGLGLYLVKQMIEAQGGRITVETKLHAGSTFSLHVPVFDQDLQHDVPAASD